jgi:hypothetical protein
VKSTIKSDRFIWLKSIYDNLEYQPKQFWNDVSKFRKDNNSPAQFQIDCNHLTALDKIANYFSKHFQSVYNNTPSGVLKLLSTLCSVTLTVATVNVNDVNKAIKQLRSTKYVGLDGIRRCVVKRSSETFTPLLKFIFNLSVSTQTFPATWKKSAIIPVFKKRQQGLCQ